MIHSMNESGINPERVGSQSGLTRTRNHKETGDRRQDCVAIHAYHLTSGPVDNSRHQPVAVMDDALRAWQQGGGL